MIYINTTRKDRPMKKLTKKSMKPVKGGVELAIEKIERV